MVTIKTGYKSVVLAVAMASSGFCGANMPASFVPTKAQMVFATTLAVLALKVDLDTQKSCNDYKLSDWYDDAQSFLGSYNLLDAESRKTVRHLLYKWVRGSKLKLKDITVRVNKDDGSIETLKDKKLVCKPFGLMGCFDAFVLSQLKSMQDLLAPSVFMYLLLMDPNGLVAKAMTNQTATPVTSTSVEIVKSAA